MTNSPSKPKLAPCIMVVGTGSSVGKSLIVAGLCRWFHRQGLKAAPFKSQNMALNSFVTADGKEIGTAQAMQAAAAGMEPSVAINPILLKPEGQRRSQVIVNGEVVQSMSATDYHRYKPELRQVVADALQELRLAYDVVVIEGAGSPVEMNLKSHDIVNMFVAQLAEAKVLIVGDIDKGGIFASLIGTYNLLSADEQGLVAGFIINKFRGDPALLGDGLDFIRQQTGAPVLGVLPMLSQLTLPDEDGHLIRERLKADSVEDTDSQQAITVGIIKFPRMSNFDEFALLRQTPGFQVRLIEQPCDVLACHLVILPGSKQTAADLGWLQEAGLAAAVKRRIGADLPTLAICGGFQMLGQSLVDNLGMESSEPVTTGLGVLPLITEFQRQKTLRQVRWQLDARVGAGLLSGLKGQYSGYEIHCGQIRPAAGSGPIPAPLIVEASGRGSGSGFGSSSSSGVSPEVLSAVAGREQNLFGTLVHGVLSHAEAIACLEQNLRAFYFLPKSSGEDAALGYEQSYERLADALSQHLPLARLAEHWLAASGAELSERQLSAN